MQLEPSACLFLTTTTLIGPGSCIRLDLRLCSNITLKLQGALKVKPKVPPNAVASVKTLKFELVFTTNSNLQLQAAPGLRSMEVSGVPWYLRKVHYRKYMFRALIIVGRILRRYSRILTGNLFTPCLCLHANLALTWVFILTIHVEQERPSNLTVSFYPDRKRISRRLAQGSTQISSGLFWLYWSRALEISPLCQPAAFIECDMYDTSIQLLSAPNGHVPRVRSYPLNMYLKQYFPVPPQFLQDWQESCRSPAGILRTLPSSAKLAELGRTGTEFSRIPAKLEYIFKL